MKILFLDDERMPHDVTWLEYAEDAEFHVVRDLQSFIEAFVELEPDVVSFDHDLGVNSAGKLLPSGYDCVKAAISFLFNNHDHPIPKAVFHSKNPVGSQNMRLYWKQGVKELREFREI